MYQIFNYPSKYNTLEYVSVQQNKCHCNKVSVNQFSPNIWTNEGQRGMENFEDGISKRYGENNYFNLCENWKDFDNLKNG